MQLFVPENVLHNVENMINELCVYIVVAGMLAIIVAGMLVIMSLYDVLSQHKVQGLRGLDVRRAKYHCL